MNSDVVIDNRPGVKRALEKALARVQDETVPIDLADPAYWQWVFDGLPPIVDLLVKQGAA